MNCCPLRFPPQASVCAPDLPQTSLHVALANTHTPSEAGRGGHRGHGAASAERQRNECSVMFFQNTNDKGNGDVEGVTGEKNIHVCSAGERMKETWRGSRAAARWKFSVASPQLPSPAAPRRSMSPPPPLSLCGPELRVIPKQSALIQGARGPGAQLCQSALTLARTDARYTRPTVHTHTH